MTFTLSRVGCMPMLDCELFSSPPAAQTVPSTLQHRARRLAAMLPRQTRIRGRAWLAPHQPHVTKPPASHTERGANHPTSNLTPRITRREAPAGPSEFSMTSALAPVGCMPMLNGGARARRQRPVSGAATRRHDTRDITGRVLPSESREIQRRGRRDGKALPPRIQHSPPGATFNAAHHAPARNFRGA